MMEHVFKNRSQNIEKMLFFGFQQMENGYVYRTDLVDGQMKLTVTVNADARVFTEITDNSSGEEYVLHRVTGAAGTFVGRVKSEYEAVLEGIAAKCFDPDVFKSEQAKAVIAYMGDTYGDEPEFLWQKFPDNAVVRRKDNRKWYAAILTVSRRKLGSDSDALVEILDLRIKPEELEHTIDNIKYFPGYHMNKKHWYTICLDGSVSIEEIDRRIDESYFLAKK